jgi:atypical dual specificity phosphatase
MRTSGSPPWIAVALGVTLLSCAATVDVPPATGGSGGDVHNFSWVVEDKLAGMARPGAVRTLDEDLASLEAHGIKLLVSLTETATPAADAARYGIEVVHLPVVDFTPPSQEQLFTFAHRSRESLAAGAAVGVHCAAGQGRTGTTLAAYFVTEGMTADEAIAEVRRQRPGSIETSEQEQAVRTFHGRWRAVQSPIPPPVEESP